MGNAAYAGHTGNVVHITHISSSSPSSSRDSGSTQTGRGIRKKDARSGGHSRRQTAHLGWGFQGLYARFTRTFHKAWRDVTFRDESDTDDVELNVVRYKVDGIDTLARTTKFTKKELQLMYRGFKAECPHGVVSEETFKGIYSQFFPQGDATAYAHYVFNTFDTDNNGSISFENFVTILSELSRGTTTEKLRWAFSLYDINGDGLISRQELMDIISAVYSLVGRNASPSVEESTTREHVDRIFEKLDMNGDGVVTLEEFMEICQSDETIANSMTILDTAFNCDIPRGCSRPPPPPPQVQHHFPQHGGPAPFHPFLDHHQQHPAYQQSLYQHHQALYHQQQGLPGVSFSPYLPPHPPPLPHAGAAMIAGPALAPQYRAPNPMPSPHDGVHRSPLHHRSMPGDHRTLQDLNYVL